MENNKQDKAIRRGVILHQILIEAGYFYKKSQDKFDFYEKDYSENIGLYKLQMAFNTEQEDAIIVFFGVRPIFPVSNFNEVLTIEAGIIKGTIEQDKLNKKAQAEEDKEVSK